MPEDWYFVAQHSLERQQVLLDTATEAHRIARVTRGRLRRNLAQGLIHVAGWLGTSGPSATTQPASSEPLKR